MWQTLVYQGRHNMIGHICLLYNEYKGVSLTYTLRHMRRYTRDSSGTAKGLRKVGRLHCWCLAISRRAWRGSCGFGVFVYCSEIAFSESWAGVGCVLRIFTEFKRFFVSYTSSKKPWQTLISCGFQAIRLREIRSIAARKRHICRIIYRAQRIWKNGLFSIVGTVILSNGSFVFKRDSNAMRADYETCAGRVSWTLISNILSVTIRYLFDIYSVFI